MTRGVPVALLTVGAFGCGGPPPSRFPDAESALQRMAATYACSRGLSAEARIDYFEDRRRVRGTLLYLASLPEQVRFDVVSPFGATVLTLTSDGTRFTLLDLVQKQFLHGPASPCNVARFTRLPVPPFALVQLLRGEAPVLVHERGSATLDWSGGAYVVRIPGRHQAEQEIRLVPTPDDWERPWQEQRVRVTEVAVEQRGVELYRVSLDDHRVATTAPAREDPEGLEAPLLPSGPECRAEVPRAVRIEVPVTGQDLVLKTTEAAHNPPLTEGVYTQPTPPGVKVRYAVCDEAR